METAILIIIALNLGISIYLLTRPKGSDNTSFVREIGNFKFDLNEIITNKFESLFKENKQNETNLRESTDKFLKDTDDNIRKHLDMMSKTLTEKFDSLNTSTREKLDNISERVDKKLDQGFEKTNETFQKIIERMAKIDEAQKNIEKLSTDVVSLQSILNDSKSRGIFGEVQLDHILANIFGEDNDKFYEMQYNFPETKVIVDCVVKTHQGLIPIDSKFPLVNYQKMFEEGLSAEERTAAKKLFVSGVKKQIDDISSKYIIHEKTLDSALMFIPAESVFAELYTNFFEIIDYAHSKGVNIVSPTTLMAMLTIVLIAMKSLETQKQAIIIQRELGGLSIEFNRFVDRRGTFTKDFDKVHSDVTGIDITNKKIISKFASIEKLEFIEENDEDNPKAIL